MVASEEGRSHEGDHIASSRCYGPAYAGAVDALAPAQLAIGGVQSGFARIALQTTGQKASGCSRGMNGPTRLTARSP